MAREIYVVHTGTDTFFTMADTGFIFAREDVDKERVAGSDEWESFEEGGSAAPIAFKNGYMLDETLAEHIYELAKAYHEYQGEITVLIDPK